MARFARMTVLAASMAWTLTASATKPMPTWVHYDCSSCNEWNQPQKPFKVHGNTWYVGTTELSALLITGPQGHVLLDGALPQSAPLIAASIKALGFRIEDVKLILNSHEHFDHAGGIGPLRRASGAQVAASAIGAAALRAGRIGPADPQFDASDMRVVDPVPMVLEVKDGDVLEVGTLSVKAHMTPGHAPGGTSWSWTSCEDGKCLNVVYADSLTLVSKDGYRFSDHPERIDAFRSSVSKIAALKCDIIISTHPGFTNTMQKAAAKTSTSNPFINSDGCRTYAAEGAERLAGRMLKEAGKGAK